MWRFLGVALTSLVLLIGAAIPAAADDLMRVTFVRHGESEGNASGLIDTSTPGPVLTPTGQQQAQAVASLLGDNNYDAIYASTMVRTQLTAAPMSQYLRLPIQVLPGLQEIEAGVFEGTPEADAAEGYALIPLAWAFQGDLDVAMPGTSPPLTGHVFDDRVDSALQTIYDNGDRNPVVFSHGGTIMFWTMMNAVNLTLEQKINLLSTAPLSNTDYVIVEGNNEDGWTLVNWNGQLFSPEPTLAAEVQRQVRTLTRQLAATWSQVADSFSTGDFTTILTAINRGIADATYSVVKFTRAVGAKVIHELDEVFGTPTAPPSEDPAATPLTDTDQDPIQTVTSVVGAEQGVTPTVTSVTDTRRGSTPTLTSVTDNHTIASAAAKSDAVEAPAASLNALAAPSASAAANVGTTGLKDGNKVVPGTPSRDSGDNGSDAGAGSALTGADSGISTPGSAASSDGSKQSDAA